MIFKISFIALVTLWKVVLGKTKKFPMRICTEILLSLLKHKGGREEKRRRRRRAEEREKEWHNVKETDDNHSVAQQVHQALDFILAHTAEFNSDLTTSMIFWASVCRCSRVINPNRHTIRVQCHFSSLC